MYQEYEVFIEVVEYFIESRPFLYKSNQKDENFTF